MYAHGNFTSVCDEQLSNWCGLWHRHAGQLRAIGAILSKAETRFEMKESVSFKDSMSRGQKVCLVVHQGSSSDHGN